MANRFRARQHESYEDGAFSVYDPVADEMVGEHAPYIPEGEYAAGAIAQAFEDGYRLALERVFAELDESGRLNAKALVALGRDFGGLQ